MQEFKPVKSKTTYQKPSFMRKWRLINPSSRGSGQFLPKNDFVFNFAKCPSHYARLICKVPRGQDFFSCLKKIYYNKHVVFFCIFPNFDE